MLEDVNPKKLIGGKKFMKKALALILSVALILSIAVLPVTVVAEEVEQTGGPMNTKF